MDDLISRQAAIDAILHITNCKSVRELFEYNQLHHLTEMWSGGVNDAIDAVIGVDSAQLGTNLAEVGTDCISRQAALDIFDDYNVAVENGQIEAYSRDRKRLCDLPPAEPKRGKWIDGIIPNDSGGLPVIVCDQCNTFFPLQFGDGHNFCPNCGADMRGEQDG